MTVFALAIIMAISSCDQKQPDSYKLCKDFYQLNKDKSFEGLYDVSIGTSRVMNVYDKSSNQ